MNKNYKLLRKAMELLKKTNIRNAEFQEAIEQLEYIAEELRVKIARNQR